MSMIKPIALKSLAPSSSAFLQWSFRVDRLLRLFWLSSIGSLTFSEGLATDYYVDGADQFNSLEDKNGADFSTLRAGDRVYLKAGNWGGLVATITGSMTDAEAENNPAQILACDANYVPTAGGVTVDGISQVSFAGSGISFCGVTFSPLSGMKKVGNYNDYGGNDSVAYLIRFNPGSRFMTASHLKFNYCGRDTVDTANNDHYGAWLFVYGYRHTIQYCEMAGRDFWPSDFNETDPTKRKSIRQATVTIYKDSADTNFGYHNIHHNFFGERKIPLSSDPRLPVCADGTPGDPNGWETIRCGNSSFVNEDFNNTIEKNVFYHSIWAVDGGANDQTGEPEMISNKSRKNIYRYNTILNNYGTLTLRQGDYCTVQGNYFLAGGSYDSSGAIVLTEPRNTRMGGVRAFGFGHTLANNYFYRLNSDGIRSALILGSGGTETGSLPALINGSNADAYETANYAQIFGNSFIDCKAITLDNPNNETYPVYGTQFFNNLIAYSSDIGGSGVIGNSSVNYGSPLLRDHGGRAAGNYVYSASTSQLGSAATLLGSTWLSDNFESYALGAPLSTTTSSLLIGVSSGTSAAVSGNSGKMMRFYKTNGSSSVETKYALSTGFATPRNIGFISFKLQQAPSIPTFTTAANTYLDVRLSGNNSDGISTAANNFIGLRFYQANPGTMRIYTGNISGGTATQIGGNSIPANTTSLSTVRIWYNNSSSPISYVSPSGTSYTLGANSFVLYFGNTLASPSATGSPLPATVGTASGGNVSNIGKFGFSVGGGNAADFYIDDIYVADSENVNVISSLSADNPLLSGTYDVLTVPAGTSPLLEKASALPIINDTSATGSTYNLAGTVATYGALDMRGLGRPSTGRDIGNYEIEASGLGNRPLRRAEVGVVAATYPSAIQVGTINQGQNFSQQLTTSFGVGTLTWTSLGALPGTLSLSSSGVLSGTVSVTGSYPVSIRVTDENGSYVDTTLNLTVDGISSNANLSNLALSSGTLSPAFNSNTVSYTATVSNVASIQVTPTVAQSNATVEVNGTNVTSGTASGANRLQTGMNVITNLVTAQDGTTTKTYAVSVTLDDEFNALRKKWRDTLIADVTSSKTSTSINSRAAGYQTTMLYAVTGVKVVNGGSDYTSVPTVVVSGGGGAGATATATITAGKVSAITVTSVGSGYTTTPTITVSGGGGSGVSATPIVAIWSDLPPAAQTGVTADVASGNIADSFKRLEYMAQAYAIPGCALYQDPNLLAAITGGLDWLTSNAFTPTGTIFGNWYDWMVSAPQALNNAAILLLSNPSALTTPQIANYVKAVYNYGPDSVNQKDYFYWGALTGANTSNAALSMAVQGILLGSSTTTVTRYWQNTKIQQTDYVIRGSLLLEEAQGNLSGNNPLDSSGDSVFTTVTSGDGWYADGSFIFHYNIPYTGSYGQELMENVSILVKLLDGSTWEITDPDLSNMYGWITNGTMPLMYHGAMMDMVRGRAIASSSSDQSKIGAAALEIMRSVSTFAPTDIAAELLAFADSPQVAPGQYHFASMDRVAMHRAAFSFGLSMSSARVGGYEINTTSPTNLKGWYTGAGVTYLYLGNPDTQYMDDYWATIDWYHLPGTTADLSPLSVRPQDAVAGVTDQNWVGGAQVDKTYGVAGMSAHPNGTQLYAKKSWFMLDDKIVCLGAGITSTSGGEVDTTVENRKLGKTGTTTFNIADTAYSLTAPTTWVNPVTVSTSTSPTWCALDGVAGYYFPEGASNLQAQFVAGSGAWTTINPTDSDPAIYTDYYLQIVSKHGVNPTNAKYAYVILPNRKASSVKAYAANPDVAILSNTEPTSTTTGIQAVKSKVLGVVAANFWAKTSGPDTGGTADFIAVNKQCSVIVKETYNSISVGVSDPTQSNNGTITVTLNGRTSLGTLSSDPGVTVTGTSPITLSVNVSGSKGKSFNASFSLAPSPVITSNPEMVAINGKPLSFQVTANNNPTSFEATGLPPGLSINALSGVISGTPTQSSTYTATISATNSTGTGYANLTITVAGATSDISYTYNSSTTWTCPANVTAVQVECWGAGGAGGSAYKPDSGNAFGGGGAGGSYAKKNSVSVVPGTSYTISIGEGGVSAISPSLATVSGGDSWFGSGSVASCLAKGGAGGQSVISSGSGIVGGGGVGSSTGSVGDLFFAGGNGLAGQGSPINTGGGGGGSGATLSVGGSATSYLGATGVSGGGAGGNGKDSSGNGNGSQGGSPGGGGGGARGSSIGSQTLGGKGGAGQVVLTVVGVAKVPQTITFELDPATAKVGDAARPLIATSSSGLLVTLNSSDPNVATITSGNTLNIVGVGTATLTATQTGDGNYEAALPVSVSLTVSADVLKYAFGSASGMPQNNGVTAVPVIDQLPNGDQQMTYTFDVKDDSPPLTVTYQTSTDLVNWEPPLGEAVTAGSGSSPTGFLKKQVQVTGSDRLFVRLNVTR